MMDGKAVELFKCLDEVISLISRQTSSIEVKYYRAEDGQQQQTDSSTNDAHDRVREQDLLVLAQNLERLTAVAKAVGNGTCCDGSLTDELLRRCESMFVSADSKTGGVEKGSSVHMCDRCGEKKPKFKVKVSGKPVLLCPHCHSVAMARKSLHNLKPNDSSDDDSEVSDNEETSSNDIERQEVEEEDHGEVEGEDKDEDEEDDDEEEEDEDDENADEDEEDEDDNDQSGSHDEDQENADSSGVEPSEPVTGDIGSWYLDEINAELASRSRRHSLGADAAADVAHALEQAHRAAAARAAAILALDAVPDEGDESVDDATRQALLEKAHQAQLAADRAEADASAAASAVAPTSSPSQPFAPSETIVSPRTLAATTQARATVAKLGSFFRRIRSSHSAPDAQAADTSVNDLDGSEEQRSGDREGTPPEAPPHMGAAARLFSKVRTKSGRLSVQANFEADDSSSGAVATENKPTQTADEAVSEDDGGDEHDDDDDDDDDDEESSVTATPSSSRSSSQQVSPAANQPTQDRTSRGRGRKTKVKRKTAKKR